MARFQHQKKPSSRQGLFPLVTLAFPLLLFTLSINQVSQDTRQRQRETLERAIRRDVAYCYAMEGAYPESLAYLKENYGLIYDEDYFFVDYQVSGANLFPDITILERGR